MGLQRRCTSATDCGQLAFVLRAREAADADSYIPMRSRASGPSATVVCPLKNTARNLSARTRIPVAPAHPDKICTNKTSVSFSPTAGAKCAQVLHYASPEWQQMYATARNTIEGFNGYVKDANAEALGQPGTQAGA